MKLLMNYKDKLMNGQKTDRINKMNKYYLDKANENIPDFFYKEIKSDNMVKIVDDKNNFFGCKAETIGAVKQKFTSGDSVIVDFGMHCVGRFSFTVKCDDIYLDAPVKLRLRFAEIPYEIYRTSESYKGALCASWLQEEIINVDFPGVVILPRRYCFRFVEITVIATPRTTILSDFTVKHCSSADGTNLTPLSDKVEEIFRRIDTIGIKTLADCMQSVYEDGPKRDRRLWIGDLRLQAMTDYYLFKNTRLIKRCLYMFAACEEENKYLPCCLFYEPELFFDDGMEVMDYALLYTVTLCEYYENTNDIETARDLFPVAYRQIERAISNMDKNGIITLPSGWNSFIDWADDIETLTAVDGVFLYALEKNIAFAEQIGESDIAKKWKIVLENARADAYKTFFNVEKICFMSGYNTEQYSVHAQVWMILGGVVDCEKGKDILKVALESQHSLKPVTPYMHHYVVEAMMKLQMKTEAFEYIKNYWGEMVFRGADTFWEVFVPQDVEVSPYSDNVINSFCHAWSCTPSYFIRKYLEE